MLLNILVLAFTSAFPMQQNYVSEIQARQIFAHLIEVNHLQTIPFHISNSGPVCGNNSSNAYYSSFTDDVTLCRGMISPLGEMPVHNTDELGLILGHELGHRAPNVAKLDLMHNELGADAQGKIYAGNAGYNICHGALWLKNTGAGGYDYNDAGQKVSYHPSGAERFHDLGCDNVTSQ